MQVYFENKSLKRTLRLILDDRKQTQWGTSLGIPKTVISEFFRHGRYPADKHLAKIIKAENASMDALWGVSSAPFMVRRTNHIEETNEELKLHLDDEQQDIYLITSSEEQSKEFPVFVMSVPVVENYGSKDEFKYNDIKVITGPTNHETANLLRNETVNHKKLPEEDLHLLATGFKGTYYLFGKGTLLDAKPIDFGELNETLCKEASNSAALLNRVMELIDESIIEESAELSPEQRRKLVVELYSYALKEGLMSDQVNPNLASSMLRIV